ncbi:MAG TPA: hypothetical protein VGN14_15295 [Candidatus Elarobacter sp.]
MYSTAALDAHDRIAARAQDLRDAFRPGGIPLNRDVAGSARVLPSTDPLSATLPPGAWLVTRGDDGRRTYTRDGALTLAAGTLRTHDGAEVLGYPGGEARGTVPVPLRVAATDRALGRAENARLEPDGTVAYERAAIDPRTGTRGAERVVVGRVALATFPAGTQPDRLDAARVTAPAGVAPHLGTPADGTFAPLTAFSREAGSVDIDAGVERLNEAYRQFEALGAAVRTRASVEKTTLDLVK